MSMKSPYKDPEQAKAIAKTIGKNIAKHRKKAGLTQRQFGDKLGMSISAIQNIEYGKTDITIQRLFEIAGIFNIDISQLYLQLELDDKTATEQQK